MKLEKSPFASQRMQTIHDEKQQVVDLPHSNLVAPSVGVFDEPVRYYKINKQWAKVMEGFVSWLTDTAAWKDATEDDYIGIQGILDFLVGIDVPTGEFPQPIESDCVNYPPNEIFIDYSPMNPFTQAGLVPNGYADTPFFVYDGDGSLPPQYQAGDVIVPLSAITLDPFDLFTGNLPQIQINVIGSGQLETVFVKFPFGGIVIESINNPPDIFDIIVGIISPNVNFLELEADVIAFPPEETWILQREVNIVADPGEKTTVYYTFFPTLSPSFIPIRFGGGLRHVGLCAFETDNPDSLLPEGSIVVTEAELCAIVETCLTTSATISAMNAATANAQDTADTALANSIANAIAIAVNSGRIDDNAAAIANLQVAGSNVDSTSFKRFDWVDYASDAWLTDVAEFLTVIPPNFDRVKLIYTVYSTNAVLTWGQLFANGNFVSANYQAESIAGHFTNSARIGWLPPTQADGIVSGRLEVEFWGLLANTKNIATATFFAHTAAGGVNSATDVMTWHYEVAETIDDVTLRPLSGNLKAFGGVRVQVWEQVQYVTEVINQIPIEEPQPPQPNPQGLIVDFDTGYTDYELQLVQPNDQQALLQGGGNLGNAAVNRRTDLATVANFVRVNLPVPSTVTRASFDFASTTEGGEGFTQQTAAIDFYDSGDNLLHTTNLHKIAQVAVFDVWHNHEVIQTYNNVAYIIARATTEAEFIAILETLIDNIEVDYT